MFTAFWRETTRGVFLLVSTPLGLINTITMNTLTIDQMRTMRYGHHLLGAYVHTKLRLKTATVERMMKDPEMMKFRSVITLQGNKQGTHMHIAAITHQSEGFMYAFMKAKERAEATIQMHAGADRLIKLRQLEENEPEPPCPSSYEYYSE